MNAPPSISNRPERLRLRVEDFLLLNDSGAFTEHGKTELIDGEIFYMNAQYSRHARAKTRLLMALGNRLTEIGSNLEAICEVAIRLSDHSMPEPDIVLTSWRGAGPVPVETVALIVEVSDTTLDTDLGRKLDLYAAAGVPEYWVIDVNDNRALMHEQPQADGYRGRCALRLGEDLASSTIEGLSVASDRLVD